MYLDRYHQAISGAKEFLFPRSHAPRGNALWTLSVRSLFPRRAWEQGNTKYFYKYQPLRPLDEIKADILALEQETEGLLKEILA